MGRAAEKLGRTQAAVGYFERAVTIDPRDREALDLLAMARFVAKCCEDALGLYRTLLDIAEVGAGLYLDKLQRRRPRILEPVRDSGGNERGLVLRLAEGLPALRHPGGASTTARTA